MKIEKAGFYIDNKLEKWKILNVNTPFVHALSDSVSALFSTDGFHLGLDDRKMVKYLSKEEFPEEYL